MSYFCVNHSDMKTTQEIIAILRHFKMTEGDRYGISRLGIFGSVARGEQTSDSDVDVFFEGKTVGYHVVRCGSELVISDVLKDADKALYEEKKKRRKSVKKHFEQKK